MQTGAHTLSWILAARTLLNSRRNSNWKSRRLSTCWRRDAVHRQLGQLKPESAYYAVRFSCVWTRRRDAVFVDTSRHAHWHYPSLPESTEKFAFSSSNQAEMLLLDSKSPCNVCTTCNEFLLAQARPTMPCISTSNSKCLEHWLASAVIVEYISNISADIHAAAFDQRRSSIGQLLRNELTAHV